MLEKFLISIGLKQPEYVEDLVPENTRTVRPSSENRFENKNSLIDLNNALANKSYRISIKKNYSLKKPLVVYNTTKNLIKNKNINIKLEIELEENSS